MLCEEWSGCGVWNERSEAEGEREKEEKREKLFCEPKL